MECYIIIYASSNMLLSACNIFDCLMFACAAMIKRRLWQIFDCSMLRLLGSGVANNSGARFSSSFSNISFCISTMVAYQGTIETMATARRSGIGQVVSGCLSPTNSLSTGPPKARDSSFMRRNFKDT